MIKMQITLPPVHTRADIPRAVAAQAGTNEGKIKKLEIIKKSIDARDKGNIKILYTVAAEFSGKYHRTKDMTDFYPAPMLSIPKKSPIKRPIVIGSGPAGLFAGYFLARAGARPIIFERGKKVSERKRDIEAFHKSGILCPESNVQFGEGGAGTFSDGKLATGIKSPYIRVVLETFVKMGAPNEILYNAKPHIGSDKLQSTITNLRNEIERLGGEIRFESRLEGISCCDGALRAVTIKNGDTLNEYEADALFLAIGHSARDTFEMLFNMGIKMEAKPFSVGARIEHLQSMIDKSQYGEWGGSKALGAADYKLSCHLENGLSAYTFCMCPGGYVSAAASEEGGVVTNGYSNFARDGKNANSALLIGITPQQYGGGVLGGIEYQRKIEKAAYMSGGGGYKAPCQMVGDFLKGIKSKGFGSVAPSYERGVVPGDISLCLPKEICDAMRQGILEFDKKIKGFASHDALLTAPETRSSSPVRIVRDKRGEASVKGIYPIGEGSGYAGGITSSAVDGIKSALIYLES